MSDSAKNRTRNWDNPEIYVQEVVHKASTSFFWSMRRLPEPKREAMFAVYAFCREVDDIADADCDSQERRSSLALWRGELERLYGGNPQHPISRALVLPIDRFKLRKQEFRAIIDGMEIDSVDRLRLKSIQELTNYCDLVASAVGRLSIRIFDIDPEIGDRLAWEQGQALQLTNILRDIVEDAQRNRLYIPTDLLIAHDVETDELSQIIKHKNLPQVCETLSDITIRRFANARAIIKKCDRSKVRPAIMMIEVYATIFKKLKTRGWIDLNKTICLSRVEKLWLACRYGLF